MMLQQDKPEDFVIATGVQYSVRQFVEMAAAQLGIKLRFEGEGVNEKGIVVSVTGHDAPGVNPGCHDCRRSALFPSGRGGNAAGRSGQST